MVQALGGHCTPIVLEHLRELGVVSSVETPLYTLSLSCILPSTLRLQLSLMFFQRLTLSGLQCQGLLLLGPPVTQSL